MIMTVINTILALWYFGIAFRDMTRFFGPDNSTHYLFLSLVFTINALVFGTRYFKERKRVKSLESEVA